MTAASSHDRILIVDFGSQVTQLIARRVREAGVYCEIVPFNLAAEAFAGFGAKGVILSGGPASVAEIGTPLVDISGPLPFVGVQAAFDEFFRRGSLRSYWKSTFVQDLTDPVLDLLVAKALDRPSDRTFVVTFLMGGAINAVGPGDTAYSERSAN